MRLTTPQINTILRTIADQAGAGVRVMLYGSRLDDAKMGGDVDLLVEQDPPLDLLQQASIKAALEAQLFMPVDILSMRRGAAPTAFQRIALARAVALVEAH